jgi:hypothetical protein
MADRERRHHAILTGVMAAAGCIVELLQWAFIIAVIVAAFDVALRADRSWMMQRDVARRGIELEAEILARFEAGALKGSELARLRQSMMASWDPRELELRYVFDGREIVSRGRVSEETFYRTRSMKTLKIKVDPKRPENWAALV